MVVSGGGSGVSDSLEVNLGIVGETSVDAPLLSTALIPFGSFRVRGDRKLPLYYIITVNALPIEQRH